MARWLFSKLSARGTGYVATPAALQAVLNAIMLTTGKTDRPWTLAKHGNPDSFSLLDSFVDVGQCARLGLWSRKRDAAGSYISRVMTCMHWLQERLEIVMEQ